MKTYYDCIACLVRQTLDAVRLVTTDEQMHERVLRKVLGALERMNLGNPPPVMAQQIHRIIRDVCESTDPYRNIKKRSNENALSAYTKYKKIIAASSRPLETAVRLAIAGNIIDFGVTPPPDPAVISTTLERSLSEKLYGDMDVLYENISRARHILYIGDNAGEIVFDRLLIEQLHKDKVTFVVRGAPVINDATMEDALSTGMTDCVRVIDTGSDVPGIILESCSDTFRTLYAISDLIIAKGQGNYETLSDRSENIIFLLKIKCPVIAQDIGIEPGSLVMGRCIDFDSLG